CKVTLTEKQESGFVFEGWAGDCSENGSWTVAVTSLHSVIAVFKKASIPSGTSTLTIVNNDTGSGAIQISWGGAPAITCKSDECDIPNVPNGVRVKVEPLPGANEVVGSYGGACAGTAQRCVLV